MKMKMVWLFFLVVGVAGCATVPRGLPPASSQQTLQGLCTTYNVDCRWDGISQTIELTYGGRKVRAMVGSNVVLIDANRLVLSDNLYRRKGWVLVPPDFEQVVFGSARKPQDEYQRAAQAGWIRKVMVDAGHGGKDPGAVGYRGFKEKDISLDIAQRVAKVFEAMGVSAPTTRQTDEFLSLERRTELASEERADLFLSIHLNSHKNRMASGIEVYYAPILRVEDRLSDERRNNERKMFAKFHMDADNPDVRRIVSDMLYSFKMSASPHLADALSRALCRETNGKARGSKPQRYFVLRNTLIPAVLVEVGFISNPAEARLLQDKAYRQRMAEAIVRSVLRYGHTSGM